ncbi:MAG: NAD(P)-dependent oxidoreductase [Chloroflexota bacterium]
MTMVYFEDDAKPGLLQNKTFGIIGFGALARTATYRLRDNGLNVIVSGNSDDQSRAYAESLNVGTIANTVKQSDIVLLLLPDETMPRTYIEAVSPHLRRGQTLIFSSAYTVAFGFIEPPPFVDVGVIAPRDAALRDGEYNTGGGHDQPAEQAIEQTPSYLSVWQDASRNAWDIVLAVAHAIGALKAGAIELNAEQEAELSLFIQQTILPAFHHMITKAANLLMDQGYPAEAVLIDLYLAGRFSSYIRQIASTGLLPALQNASLTSQYGTMSRMERFNDLKLERLLEVTLEEIRDGSFAREWSQEHADGHPRLSKLLRHHANMDLWELEQQTLELTDDNRRFR